MSKNTPKEEPSKKQGSEKFLNWIKNNPFVIIAALFVTLGFIVFVTYLIILFNSGYRVDAANVDLKGTSYIGDFIGGVVGAIWSLAGVLLLYAALRFQKRVFDLQRKEMTNTLGVNKLQRFENTFFQMLDFHKKITGNMKHDFKEDNGDKKEFQATQFLEKAFNTFGKMYNYVKNDAEPDEIKNLDDVNFKMLKSVKNGKDKVSKKQLTAVYCIFKKQFGLQLNHYFRFTYNILAHIKRGEEQIDNFKRKMYVDILKSSMSNIEIVLSFYDALSYDDFHNLYKKYNMNSNLSKNEYLKEEHKDLMNTNEESYTCDKLLKEIGNAEGNETQNTQS